MNGYRLIGKLENGFVSDYTTDNSLDREWYESCEMDYCPHCKTRRHRNKMWIVRDDEYEFPVGTNCFKELIDGHSIAAFQFTEHLFSTFFADVEDAFEKVGGFWKEKFFEPKIAIAKAIEILEKGEWKDNVKDYFMGGRIVEEGTHRRISGSIQAGESLRVSDENLAKAEELIENVLKIDDDNEFTKELQYCLSKEIVPMSKAALVAYAPKFYQNHLNEIERKNALKQSEFIGKVGDRQKFRLTAVSNYSFDSAFGPVNVNNFVDEDNNIFVWFTGSWSFYKGDVVELTGTIKKHEVYRDAKQTHLTRCRVHKVDEKTPEERLVS